MTFAKLKLLGAAALAFVLVFGGVQTLTLRAGTDERPKRTRLELDSPRVAQATTQAQGPTKPGDEEAPKARASKAARSVAGSRYAEVLRGSRDTASNAVSRFADVLKRHTPRRASAEGDRLQLYMMDLSGGETTLIADEPEPGFDSCGAAAWSHDGRRIVFDVRPGYQFQSSRLKLIEVRDGRPTLTDLGPGDTPTFSADDKRIAFALSSGAAPGSQEGVWVMEVDGSERRRAGEHGAPFWSPDGRQVLINSNTKPTKVNVVDLETAEETLLEVPFHQLFSWPSWAGPGTLVASIGAKQEGDKIALLDVSHPAEVKIIDFLWKRGEELDVSPLWPVYSPGTGRCFFVGLEPTKRTLYSVRRGVSVQAKMVESQGYRDRLGGLSFSPDGRFLLYCANRPVRPLPQ